MKQQRTTYFDGWRIYPIHALNHHVQGIVVAWLLLESIMPVFGVLWTALYIAYQGLSMVRKKDSAGLDVMDFMIGMLIMVAVFIAMQMGTLAGLI